METQNLNQTENNVESQPESIIISSNKNNLLLIIGFLIILIIVGIFSYYLGTQKNKAQQLSEVVAENVEPTTSPTTVQTTTENQELIPSPEPIFEYDGWLDYSTSTYSIKYPSDVEIRTQDGSAIILTMLGSSQTKDTELLDGISLRIQPFELPVTAKTYAETKIAEIQKMGISEVTSQLKPYKLNNINGWTFSSTGLGVHKYIILGGENSMIMEIINSSVDPNNKGYEDTVEKIISSIKFIN